MAISPQAKKWIQFVLIIAMAAALVRLGLIFRSRHQALPQPKKQEGRIDPEAYVYPKKIYAHDLKSARAELTRQPVWVKEGYKYVFYPYDPVRHRTDFQHEAGRLGPLERLEINDVVLDVSPGSRDQRQLMATFEKGGKWYAFPFGAERQGDFQIYASEILFIEDPHQLYSFWSAEVWQAIEQHQVRAGMNELQATFAVGVGLLEKSLDSERVLRYPNNGRPLQVIFRDGKAVDIKPAGDSGVQLSLDDIRRPASTIES